MAETTRMFFARCQIDLLQLPPKGRRRPKSDTGATSRPPLTIPANSRQTPPLPPCSPYEQQLLFHSHGLLKLDHFELHYGQEEYGTL